MVDEVVKFVTGSIKEFTLRSISKLLVFLVLILALLFICFPFIRDNFISYSHIQTKANVIEKLGNISSEKLLQDPQLQSTYNRTLEELDQLDTNRTIIDTNLLNFDNSHVGWKKIISGSILGFLLTFIFLFDKKSDKKQKIKSIGLLLFLSSAFGVLALLVPIFFGKPWITYVSIPILQIVIIVIIAIKTRKKDQKIPNP